MIKRLSMWLVLAGSCLLISCDDLVEPVVPGLSQEEVVAGLKEALRVGTDTSVSNLNRENGYYMDEVVKIMLPPEIVTIQNNINNSNNVLVSFAKTAINPLIEKLVLQINRSAEDAAAEAKPIFVNAITGMTIADGWAILNGTDTSATSYLRGATFNELKSLFQPKIENSLSKPLVGGVSAASTYSDIVSTYNGVAAILGYSEMNPSLSDYTTGKALNGLFLKVADEEKAIRTDPVARVTDILQKVFGRR